MFSLSMLYLFETIFVLLLRVENKGTYLEIVEVTIKTWFEMGL